VDRGQLEELLELARWAPNHNLTNPWRFRVIGPEALERLKEAAGPEAASKLDRAPTLIVCLLRADRRCDPGRGGPACHRVRRPTSSCSPRTAGASPPIGGLPRSFGARRARRPSACQATSGFVGLLHLGTPRSGAAAAPSAWRADQVIEFLD